jgi:hypothetical protein
MPQCALYAQRVTARLLRAAACAHLAMRCPFAQGLGSATPPVPERAPRELHSTIAAEKLRAEPRRDRLPLPPSIPRRRRGAFRAARHVRNAHWKRCSAACLLRLVYVGSAAQSLARRLKGTPQMADLPFAVHALSHRCCRAANCSGRGSKGDLLGQVRARHLNYPATCDRESRRQNASVC